MSPESQPAQTPQVTDDMREQAKQTPNSWLYIVDPGYEEAGEDVPPEGVVGAFRIDENGEIGEFFPNDEYEPTEPVFEPTNELERVLHLVSIGQADENDLPRAVLEAELMFYAESFDDEALYEAEMSDGSTLVPACTSKQRVPEDWPAFRSVSGSELADVLNGLDLGLNLDDPLRAVIPYEVLVDTSRLGGPTEQ